MHLQNRSDRHIQAAGAQFHKTTLGAIIEAIAFRNALASDPGQAGHAL
jgi:phage protein D